MVREPQSEQERSLPAVNEAAALRCHCGSLLARLVPGGVEVKCRRCKRTIVIALQRGSKGSCTEAL
jgi:hypothetical protein